MSETTPQIAANPLLDDVANWLMEIALRETGVEELVESTFVRLHAAGIPLIRVQVAFRVLYPLYGAVSMVWTPSGGMETERFPANVQDSDDWLLSPGHYLIGTGTPFMRRS